MTRPASGIAVGSLLAAALTGCGGASGAGSDRPEPTPTIEASGVLPDGPNPRQKEVILSIETEGAESTVNEIALFKTRSDSFTVRGEVDPATATVGWHRTGRQSTTPVSVHPDGTFTTRLPTHKSGANDFVIEAEQSGYRKDDHIVGVIRKLSPAQLAAQRAARERARAAARQSFINRATTIPYNQLEKNADRYKGKRVVYRGQIFQIQEDGDNGGIMLLSVTDEGYGFWDDNIWIDYDHSIRSAKDDIITVYGRITGQQSYETQIGGETYVPRMRAKYIVE